MRERYAFRMFLNDGMAEEYKRRHDAIWPELSQLLSEAGIRNYSIHLDTATHILFAYLEREPHHTMADLPSHPVMKKWWAYMGDIMRANEDGSPVTEPLQEMFFMA